MKKIVAGCISAVMLFALVGCGDKKDYSEFFVERNYSEVDLATFAGDVVSDGTYAYSDDDAVMKRALNDIFGLSEEAVQEVESVLAASRMEKADSVYLFYSVEFKDQDMLEDVFDGIAGSFSQMAAVVATRDDEGDVKYIYEDEYLALAYKDDDGIICTEYLVDGDNILILNGAFTSESEVYTDFVDLCDYLGRECVILSLG